MKDGCIHHWRIETPAGRESEGRCKKCGVTRVFLNGADYWEYNRNDGPFNVEPRRLV